jgi:hypothetical protein
MPYPSTACGWATPETASLFYGLRTPHPFGHPTPYAYGVVVSGEAAMDVRLRKVKSQRTLSHTGLEYVKNGSKFGRSLRASPSKPVLNTLHAGSHPWPSTGQLTKLYVR